MSREFSRDERRAIRTLVTGWCANFDSEYGCLPLDCPCYMLNKWWTGALCHYFQEAVLPLNPLLEKAVTEDGPAPDTRSCTMCGRLFLPEGKQTYCSAACTEAARRKRQKGYMRKRRAGC